MSSASSGLTQVQNVDLLILERTTSVFSIVGCALIFGTFVFSHRFRRPVNRLIFYASWGNLLMTIATLMSVTPALLEDPKYSPLCRFQGFMIQMFLPADALWNLSIAINVYLIVFKNWSAIRLRRLEPIYILLNYGITFAVAFTYLFIDDGDPGGSGRIYGPATLWCWVDRSWDGFRIWLCYAPAWVCIIAVFFIYILAWIDIFRKKKAHTALKHTSHTLQTASLQSVNSKLQEVRVITEIRRTSFHTPLSSPGEVLIAEHTSKHLFNPFSLDPTNLRGYDTYSITIERGERSEEVKNRLAAAEANAAAWSYTRTALLYFISLLITWLPSSMNRVYSLAFPGEISFAFSIMAGLVLPLVGFWNAVIYIITSWDAVIAVCKDMMLRERISALSKQRGRCRFDDSPMGVEILSVKDTMETNHGPESSVAARPR